MYAEQAGPIRHLNIWNDVSKRPSKCRACKKTIPSKSKRVALEFIHAWQPFGVNGQGSKETKVFFHDTCFHTEREEDCSVCRRSDYKLTLAEDGVRMCLLCFIEKPYRSCLICGTVNLAKEFETVYDDHACICKHCKTLTMMPTENDVKKEKKLVESAKKKISSLIKGTEEWRK